MLRLIAIAFAFLSGAALAQTARLRALIFRIWTPAFAGVTSEKISNAVVGKPVG